jgi:hypothetical protein
MAGVAEAEGAAEGKGDSSMVRRSVLVFPHSRSIKPLAAK